MEASITFKSVAKKNKDETLLAELTFGVEKNTRFALVGPNGSGKSTILKLICGFIHKDKGSIYIKGFDADINSNQIKSIIGYMPQKSDFDQDLNIFENLSIYGQLYGMSSDDARKRIEYLAHKLNFLNYLKLHSIEIPCGVFKKLLLARALLHDPEILILDEPTMGLDPVNRELIWNYLDSIRKDKTIFYSTQNFFEAQEESDRNAILYDGTIKFNGTFNYLVKNTFGMTKFTILFTDNIPKDIIKKLSVNPKIIKPVLSENKLQFYSTEKSIFFQILKEYIIDDIADFDSSKCSLEDIFKGIQPGEIE